MECGHIRTNHGTIQAILAYGNTHKDYRIRAWSILNSSDRLRSKKLATLPVSKSSFLPFTRKCSQCLQETITCLALNYTEGLLYSGSLDGTVKAWKLTESTHFCADTFLAHDAQVNALVVNQRDGCLFTRSSDGSVKIWRWVFGDYSHTVIAVLRFQSSPVNTLVLSSSSFCLYSMGTSTYGRRRRRLQLRGIGTEGLYRGIGLQC